MPGSSRQRVWYGAGSASITKPVGHDDHINAVAGVAHVLRGGAFEDIPLVWPEFIPKTRGDRWSGEAWDGGHISHGPEYSGLGGSGVWRDRGW